VSVRVHRYGPPAPFLSIFQSAGLLSLALDLLTLTIVTRRSVDSRSTTLGSYSDHSKQTGVTAADELFFSLDGRLLSADDDEWRLEVCGVHSSGTDHWVQLNLHGLVGWGITLRTDSLDAGGVLDRVNAWLHETMPAEERSRCFVAD
jgi:hypothetical protein